LDLVKNNIKEKNKFSFKSDFGNGKGYECCKYG